MPKSDRCLERAADEADDAASVRDPMTFCQVISKIHSPHALKHDFYNTIGPIADTRLNPLAIGIYEDFS
jgi:hypothetical protein